MVSLDQRRGGRGAARGASATLALLAILVGACGQGGAVPTLAPTPVATAAPTLAPTPVRTTAPTLAPSQAPTPVPTKTPFTSDLILSWQHFTGYSELCFGVVTTPMQPGLTGTFHISSLSGRGITGPTTMNRTLDAAGAATGRFTIAQYDTFIVTSDFGDPAPARGWAESRVQVTSGNAPRPCR